MGLFDKEDTISTIMYIDSHLPKKIVPIYRIFDTFYDGRNEMIQEIWTVLFINISLF